MYFEPREYFLNSLSIVSKNSTVILAQATRSRKEINSSNTVQYAKVIDV